MNYIIFASEANRPDPKLAIPIAGDDAEAVQVAPIWCATPASIRWWSASSPMRSRFQRGGRVMARQ